MEKYRQTAKALLVALNAGRGGQENTGFRARDLGVQHGLRDLLLL